MLKKLLLGIFVIPVSVCAQSLSMEVIGSAGDHFTSASASISWTVGEVMTETFTAGSSQLTQGFHQPDRQTVELNENGKPVEITLAPNPTHDNVQLYLDGVSGNIELHILNALGQEVLLISDWSEINNQLNTSQLQRGVYFLKIIANNSLVGTVKFQKL